MEGGAGAAYFFQDSLTFGLPFVGPGIGIAVIEVGLNVASELADRGETAGADDIGGQIGKEALDKVHPGRGRRCEVHLEAWVPPQPRRDLGVLMGCVVILNEVDVDILWRFAVDLLQKTQPFDVGMALLGARDQAPLKGVECLVP